jgi:hypothetical protein
MHRVSGHIDGVVYTVEIGGASPPSVDGTPERFGLAYGSPNAIEVLRSNQGVLALATPTGPELVVDPTDGDSLTAALMAHTTVTTIEGDVPAWTVPEPGVVY